MEFCDSSYQSIRSKQRGIHEICFVYGSGRRLKHQCLHPTKLHCSFHNVSFVLDYTDGVSSCRHSGPFSQSIVKLQDILSKKTCLISGHAFSALSPMSVWGPGTSGTLSRQLFAYPQPTLSTSHRSCLERQVQRWGAGPRTLYPGYASTSFSDGKGCRFYPFPRPPSCDPSTILDLPPIAFKELVMSRCHPTDHTRRAISRST